MRRPDHSTPVAPAATPLCAAPDAPVAQASGYRHPAYAAALDDLGTPRALARSGAWILERTIPGTDARDGMGCYPLFACARWPALPDDVRALERALVTLVVVTDPFGAYDRALLERTFGDVVVPFKEHFVVDLARPLEQIASSHHRRNARRARAAVAVERLDAPASHAAEWCALYAALARRHGICGPAAFPARSLAAQLRVPGLVAFRARAGATTIGMTLWFVEDGVAYYHLGAYADRGYALGASFVLFWEALRALREEAAWASLGAGAGLRPDPDDGLARFKAGWATGTRTAWLCGRVLDRARHEALVGATRAPATGYFPAYRAGAAA